VKQIKQDIKVNRRLFRCENGSDYLAYENSCLFCNNCTDIFYDYTHGPYLMICDLDCNTQNGMAGQCCWFKDDGSERRFEE